EAEARAGLVKALLEELGELPLPGHAAAEARIVVAPAAHRVHPAHDVLRLERVVPLQPVLEEILDLPRQPHQRVARLSRAVLPRAASSSGSSGWPFRTALPAAPLTPTGPPASDSRLMARSRRAGAEQRGSSVRARS